MIVNKKRSRLELLLLRWFSYLTGTVNLGMSTSGNDLLLREPVVPKDNPESVLSPQERMLTVPVRRKSLANMDESEIQNDEADRQARYELIQKLRLLKIALPNHKLLNVMNFDGPPKYVPRQENTVFLLSGHSMTGAGSDSAAPSKFILENMVDGTSIELTREQLESFFQKVS